MDKQLLTILACPKCKGDVKERGSFLVCRKCRLAYPVLDSVPDMLISDAWNLQKAQKARYCHALKL